MTGKKNKKKIQGHLHVLNRFLWILSLVLQMNEWNWQPLEMLEEDFVVLGENDLILSSREYKEMTSMATTVEKNIQKP